MHHLDVPGAGAGVVVFTLVARETPFEVSSFSSFFLGAAFLTFAIGFAIGFATATSSFAAAVGSFGPAALLFDLGGMIAVVVMR